MQHLRRPLGRNLLRIAFLAIFRGEEVLLPTRESRLRSGDGLLMLCAAETEAILKAKLLLPKATPGPGLTQVPV